MILYDAAITDVVNFIPPPETWENCLRAIKPGAHLLAFCSTANHHRNTAYIEDAGFEIRDCIAWVFDDGGGSIVSPGMDLIAVARKPLECKTVAANVLKWGTGALNIDGCRIESNGEHMRGEVKSRNEGGWADSKGMHTPGRGFIPTDHPGGRWPANVILERSEEVIELFPQSNGSGRERTLKRGKRNGEGWGMADQPGTLRDAGIGSAARFFFQAGPDGPRPPALIAYLHRLITPPGGTAYDPVTLDPWPTPMVECSGNLTETQK